MVMEYVCRVDWIDSVKVKDQSGISLFAMRNDACVKVCEKVR